MSLPYLLSWVRVLLLIRSITSTTWGHEAWPEMKPVLRRPGDAPADRQGGLVELNAAGRRLCAALAALILAGCATTPTAAARATSVPSDFGGLG